MTEYHLVLTPDAFQFSPEVDFYCETGTDWSYGPADKVKKSWVLYIKYNYFLHSSTIRSKDGKDKSVSLIHEPLKEEETTNAYWEMQGGILGPVQLGIEDDIINLISIQDGSGSADMQNVFGVVSYLTG